MSYKCLKRHVKEQIVCNEVIVEQLPLSVLAKARLALTLPGKGGPIIENAARVAATVKIVSSGELLWT
jgi:hypothetical protein